MSYARDYLLGNGTYTFLGILGGPLLPIMFSTIAIVLMYKTKIDPSILFPIAVLGSIERMILYLAGLLPSDERNLSEFLQWDMNSFKYIFLSIEIILLSLILYFLFKYRIIWKMKILCLLIPVISFIVMAAFGVFVVERFVFPEQFNIQFR